MRYVDGFVLPVAKKNIPAYRRLARLASRVWKDHGALEYRECVGADLKVRKGCGLPYPKALRLKRGETVVFAWITYKSRADRDRVNALVMKDPRLAGLVAAPMPFDVNRMLCGTFTVLVDA